jgi:cytochrome b6-f complex iron-sulfur subunit
MNKTTRISRRDFLKLSTNALFGLSGLLGLGGLIRYFNYLPEPEIPTEFDLGELANYPIDSRTIRSDIPAVIYNRAGKIAAYSLLCTHLGCTIEENGAEFACPCHGSQFDRAGTVLKGPAQKPLKNLRVEVLEDNTLRLYTRG